MTAPRRAPLDRDLYDTVVEEAKHRFAVWPSAYASGWVVKTYKERGGKYAGQARGQDTGLTKWFGEEWVDLSRPTPDGGYEPCGRKSSDDPADYPKCRPLAEALRMSPDEVADAVRRKRRAERQVEPVAGRSRAPVMVPTYREDEDMRRNPAELLLLNPAATRTLTMGEVQHVMADLQVPKPWRTRFMQGLTVEWSEHGGGIDAHSVGSLVIDHLNEDEDYYRRARQNPAVRIPKGMRPVIEAYGEQIAKLASRVVHEVTGEPLDVQWTPRTEPLGAGSWGVVYPTRDPRFVVKVTADPTEGPIVSTIMSEPQLHDHMGIIHYFALRRLPDDVDFRGKTFPVFVIIAERLKDVGGLRGMSTSREDQHLTRLLMKIKDVAGKLVHEKQKKRPSQRLIDDLDGQYLDLVGQINDGPLSDFFFQFRDATETGVLADVHLNNLGKRAVDWETVTNGAVPLSDSDWHWVISDPGHSSVETHPDIAPLRENPRRRNPSPLPEGFFTRFGIGVPDDYVPPTISEARRVLRGAQRGDVVTVGRTQWVIKRPVGDVQAYAYKHPSKRTKTYEILLAGTDDDEDEVVVFEVGGSGQQISEVLATGPLRRTGETADL